MLFLIACSYTTNSVSGKENQKWVSQGSILQITHLIKLRCIDDSNHSEDLRLKNHVEQSGKITNIG